jgi:hypothetical protein
VRIAAFTETWLERTVVPIATNSGLLRMAVSPYFLGAESDVKRRAQSPI